MTPGQVAKRWGVNSGRVRSLVRAGLLAAFEIPEAGGFGRALKIPVSAVLAAEKEWEVLPARNTIKPPPIGTPLRHLRRRSETPKEKDS